MLFAATDLWCGAPPADDDVPSAGRHRGIDRPFAELDAIRTELGPDDRILLQRLADADAQVARTAFETLYKQYAPGVARFAYGYVRSRSSAEDIVGDVFFAVWARRATWAPRYGIRAYLYAAARHRALNLRRAEQRALRHLHEYATEWGEGLASDRALDAPDVADRQTRLMAAVATLPEDARRLAELRWHHGMSPVEIADVLGINRAAVDNRLSRLLRRIQALVR